MKIRWENNRYRRLLVWMGFMESPSLYFNGIKPTLKEAWTGIINR